MIPAPAVAVKNTSTAAENKLENKEVIAVLKDIAALLQQKNEDWFKIRAYLRVVESIEQTDESVEKLVQEGRLREIPGIGEAIAKKITELVTTGHLSYYEKLKAESSEKTE